MNVRKRLTLLLSFFALYAVIAASAAIVGTNLSVKRAAEKFQAIAGQTSHVEQLELQLTQQEFALAQLVGGQPEAMKPYGIARRKWAETLQQVAAFAPRLSRTNSWKALDAVVDEFEQECNQLLAIVDKGQYDLAHQKLSDPLQGTMIPELRSHLAALKKDLSAAQNQSARALASTSFRVVLLTLAVAVLAGLLVIVGSLLIRRWLIVPIARLQQVAGRFREGDLSCKSELRISDELGELGDALNRMAQDLASSQQKHRTLFSNLRDAVVLCDRDARVVEYHDGDTKILGVAEEQHIGRPLLEVWPEWCVVVRDWEVVIRSAIDDGRRVSAHDVQLGSTVSERDNRFADFVIYRVDCGTRHCAAIVIRDATQRHQMQDRLRHAETMEAIGTMAGGLAHDVNNLLSGVTGSLSALSNDLSDAKHRERITAALRGCRRAAGLSKRLLNFARGVHGKPQVFAPAPVIRTVLESIEAEMLNGVTIHHDLDAGVTIRMDQDQFTQILMNLVQNAREACTKGGRIDVRLTRTRTTATEGDASEPSFALLVVRDNGPGMEREVASRVFEPFFTTKARANARGRGMGLSIVYAAAKNAGGFVKIESGADSGTSVLVHIPVHHVEAVAHEAGTGAAGARSASARLP